jgi:nicotinamidase/pyrazinamidase
MTNFLFWDVDTQVDFLSPQGKLYVPGAENLIPRLQQLTRYAADHGIPIVASTDAHRESDPEFTQYPPHCIVRTEGQRKVEGTVLARHYTVPNRKIELPADLPAYAQIIVEKQAFDVFTNPNSDALLKLLGQREIILYGVVTEICVDRAARGLMARGYRVNLVSDAIQALNAEQASATLDFVMAQEGQVVTMDELLAGIPTRPMA